MVVLLLLLIPLIGVCFLFLYKGDHKFASAASLKLSFASLLVMCFRLCYWNTPEQLSFTAPWLTSLGSSFSIRMDGLGTILSLLTTAAYFLLFWYMKSRTIERPAAFFAWLLLAQAGMLGVFLAMDSLLFYFFWELALIPMYFLASQWGGARRIPVTFKFFIYTFLGSVFMLIGILYLQSKTADHSFALESIKKIKLTSDQQSWLFWLFFIAFAIKLPVFPFHTWQPDTYEESPTPVTAILSAIMVKMGILGLLRWVLPLFPIASYMWGDVVMSMAVAGIVYASFLAMQQVDIKRLIAYSSIAHIGLMTAGAFALNQLAYQGLLIQLFTHGINILGMWILVDIIERKTGTRSIDSLGGIAQHSPTLTIFFVIIALANIALPLTNAFVGEFLLFIGILATPSTYYWVFAVVGGLGIILSAVYTLRMIRAVFYGQPNATSSMPITLSWHEIGALVLIVGLILFFGIYPQPLLDMTADFSKDLFGQTDITSLFRKS
ncbi:MAG: NADH-quinone oxidoreductase subunit M [Bacteroidetes bacterium]|nr:NADH-quinone oxidoreductase subunit M [Bacteroidota bacterium]